MIDLKAILERTLDLLNEDSRWHPLMWWVSPEPEEMDRDRFPGIHPSDLQMQCNRALVYATVNASRDKTRKLSIKDRRCFDGGHAIHAVVQGYLLKAEEFGMLDYVEPEAPVGPAHNIVGSADALIRLNGVSAGVEIKTAGPSTFWGTKNMAKANSMIATPLSAHRRQTTAYMIGMGVEQFFFVYWDKATDEWAILPFEKDQKVAESILQETEFGLEAATRGIVPGKIDNLYVCRRCPFKTVCDRDLPLVDVDRRSQG